MMAESASYAIGHGFASYQRPSQKMPRLTILSLALVSAGIWDLAVKITQREHALELLIFG